MSLESLLGTSKEVQSAVIVGVREHRKFRDISIAAEYSDMCDGIMVRFRNEWICARRLRIFDTNEADKQTAMDLLSPYLGRTQCS